MPSLEDFRAAVASDADRAFREYVLHIDEMSLDYAVGEGGMMIPDEFKRVKVAFGFSDPNVITMRADPGGREIWYLPWKNASAGGMSQARLSDEGPPYFSTSQLTGCRFTIQYADASHTVATVLHLAGDVAGGRKPEGSATRSGIEAVTLPPGSELTHRRRYSIGQMKPKPYKQVNVEAGTTLYYDGGKAAIFGYRNNAGVWIFYAAEEKFGAGMGLANLRTRSPVMTSVNQDANG